MATGFAELRSELVALRAELVSEINAAATRAANVMLESVRSQFSVIDEKYQDVPRKHDGLQAALDAHVGDRDVHVRPPPPKRARTARAR